MSKCKFLHTNLPETATKIHNTNIILPDPVKLRALDFPFTLKLYRYSNFGGLTYFMLDLVLNISREISIL